MYELRIQNKNKVIEPLVEGKVAWETTRIGQPGKLSFNIMKDDKLTFEEGNLVTFRANNANVFYGFIFAREEDKNGIIKVTAYDQLRYLKNKNYYQYINKKASDVVRKVANEFKLNLGTIADTGFIIPKREEDNKTLFDIVYNALDLTLVNTKKMFVLYDDFGKLALRDVETMKVPGLVVGDNATQDYKFKSDIDTDTYNQIKLYRDNEQTGKRDTYIVKDSENINKWGILQDYVQVDEGVSPQAKGEALLKLKNRKLKTLQLKDCLGDVRVRAGSGVMAILEEKGIRQYMLVEKAKHTFGNDEHFMTLDLRGDI